MVTFVLQRIVQLLELILITYLMSIYCYLNGTVVCKHSTVYNIKL